MVPVSFRSCPERLLSRNLTSSCPEAAHPGWVMLSSWKELMVPIPAALIVCNSQHCFTRAVNYPGNSQRDEEQLDSSTDLLSCMKSHWGENIFVCMDQCSALETKTDPLQSPIILYPANGQRNKHRHHQPAKGRILEGCIKLLYWRLKKTKQAINKKKQLLKLQIISLAWSYHVYTNKSPPDKCLMKKSPVKGPPLILK